MVNSFYGTWLCSRCIWIRDLLHYMVRGPRMRLLLLVVVLLGFQTLFPFLDRGSTVNSFYCTWLCCCCIFWIRDLSQYMVPGAHMGWLLLVDREGPHEALYVRSPSSENSTKTRRIRYSTYTQGSTFAPQNNNRQQTESTSKGISQLPETICLSKSIATNHTSSLFTKA